MLWSIEQFPELEHLSDSEKFLALKRVPWHFYLVRVVKCLLGGAVLSVGIEICLAYILYLILGDLNVEATLALFVVLLVVMALSLYIRELRIVREAIRTEVAKAFVGQPLPFCFYCGYNLRQIAQHVCPECGAACHIPAPLIPRLKFRSTLTYRCGRAIGWVKRRVIGTGKRRPAPDYTDGKDFPSNIPIRDNS